jgi:hypothetical protein
LKHLHSVSECDLADLVAASEVNERLDLGSVLMLKLTHPVHGALLAVSNACGPSAVCSDAVSLTA